MKKKTTNEQISRESPTSLTRYKWSSLLHRIPSLRLLASIVPMKSLTKNLTLTYIERRKNKRTRCKSSLLYCIPSLRLLSFIVPEKTLTKHLTYLAHNYLELYNIKKEKKKGHLSLWPNFQAFMTQIWTCLGLHAEDDFDQFSWRLDQKCGGLQCVNKT